MPDMIPNCFVSNVIYAAILSAGCVELFAASPCNVGSYFGAFLQYVEPSARVERAGIIDVTQLRPDGINFSSELAASFDPSREQIAANANDRAKKNESEFFHVLLKCVGALVVTAFIFWLLCLREGFEARGVDRLLERCMRPKAKAEARRDNGVATEDGSAEPLPPAQR